MKGLRSLKKKNKFHGWPMEARVVCSGYLVHDTIVTWSVSG